MPKPKKRKPFVVVRVKLAGQRPVVAEQPSSSTSEVVMLAGEAAAHKSEHQVQVDAAVKKHAEACENAAAHLGFVTEKRRARAVAKRVFDARLDKLEAAQARKKPIQPHTAAQRLALAEEEWGEAKTDHLVAEWWYQEALVGARDAELELQSLLIKGLRAQLRAHKVRQSGAKLSRVQLVG